MFKIAIISSSIRTGRNSHRVALYFKNFISENNLGISEILDLKEYNFPLFDERLKYQVSPSDQAKEFAEKIKSADGIIIVTPEYNGSLPASLKNVIDLLTDEWHRKPVAISTVSSGNFGGSQVIVSLQFQLWKMKAWTVPALFPVPNVQDAYDEMGNPADKTVSGKRASQFIKELIWCMEAKEKMN